MGESKSENFSLHLVFDAPCINHRFAYVDFATLEAKTAAIAKSELPLIGRKLLIKDGMPPMAVFFININF